MTLQGILTRLGKGAALTWAEVDSNFARLKQAIEAFATRFENGALRPIVFSKTAPDNKGAVWARLNSTTNAYETMLYHNGIDWVDMFTKGTWTGVDASVAANSVLLTVAGLGTLLTGQTVSWTNLLANTGDTTVTLNGGTPIPLRTPDGFALASGRLPAGWASIATYTGTELRLLNPYTLSLFSKSFVSAELVIATVAAPGFAGTAHNLGAKPRSLRAVLLCKTADAGYPVGRELDLGAVNADYSLGNSEEGPYIQVSADETKIYFVAAASPNLIYVNDGSTGVTKTAIDTSKWVLKVEAAA